MANWSLTSLQTRLTKIGVRAVHQARAFTFQLAEVVVSGDLSNRILAAIHRLRTSGARMRTTAPKLEENRLDESVQTGVDQTKNWVNLNTETKKIVLNSRDRCPTHVTTCTRGLIGAQNSPNMKEKKFSLENVGLEGEPNQAMHTDLLARILNVDRWLRRGCRPDV